MKRIENTVKEAHETPYAQAEGDLELGLAVRITYACTDHVENRHELMVEAVFEKIAQDLGEDAARNLFVKVVGGL
ncbi:hypothetical protein DO021_22155 [Desulfobacter hydrogenophilus]|uniref:Uncharacterized protein n=1 Tax=Desulfobacter hydrogenophilus TaxID=2291 RepID=A0A328F9Q8_9BACT|nr:hypothetical protein [Desulfobacter hydrogenophilus]NDY74566.1 hypothetical protein [Desulfobacter hydrogenophilus]QBH15749.1 hypothetical protein EYB58_23015 [Desulfobacter hydrogenophilus]RAL99864.1 hypothetical protein DO021_22155 [Desulfobacter hydrogenophilus]